MSRLNNTLNNLLKAKAKSEYKNNEIYIEEDRVVFVDLDLGTTKRIEPLTVGYRVYETTWLDDSKNDKSVEPNITSLIRNLGIY